MNILYVETAPYVRKTITAVLEQVDANVMMAEHGGEGRDAFKQCGDYYFDLVITNLSMPRMNGESMIHAIRQYETNSQLYPTPILVVSGNLSLFRS